MGDSSFCKNVSENIKTSHWLCQLSRHCKDEFKFFLNTSSYLITYPSIKSEWWIEQLMLYPQLERSVDDWQVPTTVVRVVCVGPDSNRQKVANLRLENCNSPTSEWHYDDYFHFLIRTQHKTVLYSLFFSQETQLAHIFPMKTLVNVPPTIFSCNEKVGPNVWLLLYVHELASGIEEITVCV